MSVSPELEGFIHDHFRSVWALELLLHLRRTRARSWSTAALVEALRASEAVIATSREALLAGGLIVIEASDEVRYAPASDELDRLGGEIELLYAKRPDAVRRLIVLPAGDALSAFADAFRLRRD